VDELKKMLSVLSESEFQDFIRGRGMPPREALEARIADQQQTYLLGSKTERGADAVSLQRCTLG